MPGPRVEVLVRQIFKELPGSTDLDAAVDSVRDELQILGPTVDFSAELLEAREIAQKQLDSIERQYSHS